MDIGKLGVISETVKEALYVSKTVKIVGLVRKVFNYICLENLHRTYSMLLFSLTRWTSINIILARLLKVQSVLTYIPVVLVNERTARGIDPEFELPPSLTSLISSSASWTRVRELHDVLHSIATFIGLLERDSATMADAYASFVATLLTKRASSFLNAAQKQMLKSSLYRRGDRVYSPVYALAFHCDPYYNDFRTHISLHFGTSSLELNKKAVTEQCHSALETLARVECNLQSLLGEYLELSVNPCALLTRLKRVLTTLHLGSNSGEASALGCGFGESLS
ncbi:hypothetical protein BWQ96_00346 [Gracilariopsis chorda]|uniref:Uncharacterized protein n=1 Tax=Gracilariopsis chorda TaxID=448386 RepID=A0A2V3J6Y5_9FLOR|nr:hypothetical protein BWQ96_00346 [Gracilariopsis chorda]|eukprot:PXF50186.1 hypothetical protein BWQ96_00346 [Gracilariopsis chorda]